MESLASLNRRPAARIEVALETVWNVICVGRCICIGSNENSQQHATFGVHESLSHPQSRQRERLTAAAAAAAVSATCEMHELLSLWVPHSLVHESDEGLLEGIEVACWDGDRLALVNAQMLDDAARLLESCAKYTIRTSASMAVPRRRNARCCRVTSTCARDRESAQPMLHSRPRKRAEPRVLRAERSSGRL